MPRALSAVIVLFGLVCCLIALGHIVFGPAVIPGAVPVNANMDSEDRFYATLFLGFGGALVWCSRDLQDRGPVFGGLLATFFLCGVSRIVSAIAVGWPNDLFIVLGALELGLPPLFWRWRRFTLRQ